MIDKGYTKAFMQALGRIVKKGKEFALSDIPTTTHPGMIERAIKYKVLERAEGKGRYKLLVNEPWRAYKRLIDEYRHGPRPARQGVMLRKQIKLIPSATLPDGAPQRSMGPDIKIVPYGDYELVFVGRRIFLATEVALTPRRKG